MISIIADPEPEKTMKTSEIIECAIDLLTDPEYGWTRGTFGPSTIKVKGPHCIVGSWQTCVAESELYQVPNSLYNYWFEVEPRFTAIGFNDLYAKSREEVVSMLLSMYNLAVKNGD